MLLNELREHYRAQILDLAARYKAENVRVFGSVARGEEKSESDVDILVHFQPGASLLDLTGLNHAMEDLLHKEVDVISDRSLHPAFHERILAEAVPL